MTPLGWIAVALLGGIGAVARVLVSRAAGRHGTLLVNLAGAAALGVLVGAGVRGGALLLLGGGLLGAFTTFSTWMAEVSARRPPLGLLVPLALGLGAAAAGHMIGAAL